MPKVGKKTFPYTKMGMAEAYKEAEKSSAKVEKTSKMSPKQMKMAEAAKPKDKITGADFKAMKKKGK